MSERRVALAGPLNFRDLGGYPTADGRRVKWGRVFRSDSLHHLTDLDGGRLGELGVRTALDFRAHDELVEVGIGRLGELDIGHVHLPTIDRAINVQRPPDWTPPTSAAAVYVTMMEQGATAGVFAFEVYRRLRALSLLPSGAALLPQADAMQAKMKRPRRKKPVATEAQAPAPKEAAIDPKPAS